MRKTNAERRHRQNGGSGEVSRRPESTGETRLKRARFQADPERALREHAEAALNKSSRFRWSDSEHQAPHLLHELEVHQAELEIQNESLRAAERELHASRDRYCRLYDFAPVGYLTINATGFIVQANLAAAQLLGLDRAELMGRKFALFLPVESRVAFAAYQHTIWRVKDQHSCDLRLRRLGGAAFEAHLEGVAITDPETGQRHWWMALSDVTERKRVADALRRAEARLHFLVGSNPAVIYSCKPAGDYAATFVSENAGKQFGYEAAEFLENPRFWVDRVHPEDRPAVLASLAKLPTHGSETMEYRFLCGDGTYRWLRDDARLLRDGAGRPLEIVGSRIDINGRKWMEDALRQSEQSLDTFFTEAPMGLLWVTPDGRILRANRAQASMLCLRAEELFGRQVAEFGADPEILPAMVARLAKKESLHENLVRLRQRDGAILHALIDANGSWENGRMVHSRWFVRDVTRRVELQKEILGIGEGVQRRIGQDLHDDLSQQLTGIEFLTRALERRLADKLPVEAGRAREISRLTQRAIGYTRELSHTMSPMELAADGLAAALRNLADRTKRVFRIDCRFSGNGTPVPDDAVTRIYLYRIAQEAINNAIKHGKARRILVGLATNGDNIILGVEDNGVGLSAKLPAGKGFGLRIMDYRASSLGGSLSVQRRNGGGTCVVCSIPKGLRHPPGASIP